MFIDVPDTLKLASFYGFKEPPTFYLQNANFFKGKLTRLIYLLEPGKELPMSKLQEFKYFAEGQFRDIKIADMYGEVAILKSGETTPPGFHDSVNIKRSINATIGVNRSDMYNYMRDNMTYHMSMNVDSVVKDIIGVPQRNDALILVFTSREVQQWMQ